MPCLDHDMVMAAEGLDLSRTDRCRVLNTLEVAMLPDKLKIEALDPHGQGRDDGRHVSDGLNDPNNGSTPLRREPRLGGAPRSAMTCAELGLSHEPRGGWTRWRSAAFHGQRAGSTNWRARVLQPGAWRGWTMG